MIKNNVNYFKSENHITLSFAQNNYIYYFSLIQLPPVSYPIS